MQVNVRKLGVGLLLGFLSLSLGSCELISRDKESGATPTSSTIPQGEIPAAEVTQSPQPSAKTTALIAASPLTRPTDPDARVKVIQKGRSNPFAQLRPPASPQTALGGRSSTSFSQNAQPNDSNAGRTVKAPTGGSTSNQRSRVTSLPSLSAPSTSGDKSTLVKLPDQVTLPPLPEPTLAKQVQVKGIMMLSGQPRVILKAPDENVVRTVQVGDRLSNGQILITHIDMSNPQDPTVILREAGRTVTVGVGKDPVVLASALGF
ncbi:hypothetical protein [Lyngbya confervoides]|uniref:Uncharacterized protein n=1 Tax=Lyngbya confervoides BDU141951 TaxID=1574623 RepID=A0ABD4SYG6_9CYAN|nr:hypothetical protein [Lyngbya confervoides]MCM1981501.1 hypothetical protein [Lyngbya confervoides BDU141951]